MVRVWGSDGHLIAPTPWIPSREGGTTKLIVRARGAKEETTYEVTTDQWLYAIEADCFARGVENGVAPWPAKSVDDTLGNMRTLDCWRESAGLVYNLEKPENQKRPLHGGRLTAPKKPEIPSAGIPGLSKPVSRLIMGCDNQPNIAYASVMFDDWFERGGNAFDTAYVYGGHSGRSERLLGWWVRNRRVRDKVVIIDKGAHTPFCTPEHLLREHEISLDRLQTDYVDLYLMHRDNPDVPVGEFVDLLNRLVRKGSIRAFGASNWRLDRFRKAQDYAKRNKLKGFAALSNQLSLAEMLSPVWGGCLSAKDDDFLAYLEKTQTPLLPWSSQSRGFFTDRADPSDRSDEEMVRCWYSKANWKRRERAYKLAADKGVEPINIALAWVLAQPFPTFPLIGPRTISETVSSLKALAVNLTPDEVSWLETGRAPKRRP
jgi:aryl-alcohol dehydrogenase-like predicted oxidoreductase